MKNGLENFEMVKEKLYFIISNDIDLYRNNTFVKQFSIDNPNFWWCMWGRDTRDIFFGMSDGLVHYNGTDFQYIYNYPPTNILGSVLFEKEVLFALWNGATSKNMILVGKLKD